MLDSKIRPPSRFKNAITRIRKTSPTIDYLVSMLWFRKKMRINKKRVRGVQNSIEKNHVILNGIRFNILGDNNSIRIDPMAVLESVTLHIHGNNNRVHIGAKCRISNSIIWIEDNCCEIQIGRQTTFGGVHIAATEDNSKVMIGEDCMLANDIDIRTGDSHGIYDLSGHRLNRAEDIIIGDHVWIAAHVTILKGTVVGTGSIVGTGALVAKNIYPASCIIAGNPAKTVKQNIQWTRLRNPANKDEKQEHTCHTF